MEVRLLRGPLLAIADRTEFEAGYVATWQRVYRYAWVLTRHREDAEDVASETYRRAIGKILSVSPGVFGVCYRERSRRFVAGRRC